MCSKSRGAQIVNRAEPRFQEFSRWRKETHHSSNRGGGNQHTVYCSVIFFRTFKICVTVSLELSHVFCALQLYVPKQLPGGQVLANLYLPRLKFWLARATGQNDFSSPWLGLVLHLQNNTLKLLLTPCTFLSNSFRIDLLIRIYSLRTLFYVFTALVKCELETERN